MYNNIQVDSYEEYEILVKKMLREQLAGISQEEFNNYFKECKKDIKKDFNSNEPDGASLLSYALFLNY